jgi:hypothetical protein
MGEVGRSGRGGGGPLGDLFRQLADRITLLRRNCSRGLVIDDAFAALEEGYQSRAEWRAYLNVDPQMDPLRRDRRYTNLLKRLGL